MAIEEPPFSDYGRASLTPSPVRRMMAQFASDFRDGVDVNLGVGYVNENTIPRHLIVEAVRAVLEGPRRYDKPLNYGASKGYKALLEAIRRYIISGPGAELGRAGSGLGGAGARLGGAGAGGAGGITEEDLAGREIVIGVSGATSLLEAMACVLRRGIVVTADPMYYIYCNFIERLGWEILPVPEDGDGMRMDLLEAKLAALGPRVADVRFFYAVTVNNPTGTIMSSQRRIDLRRIAEDLSRKLGRKVPVVFDKAYEELIHDPAAGAPRSAIIGDEMHLVYEISTVSKILAPGLRIGYMVGPDGPLLRVIVQRVSDIGFSAPPINQVIAAYMLDHHIAAQVQAVNAGYRLKALAVRGWLERDLGPRIEHVTGGQAGFYYYITLRDVETCEGSAMLRFLSRATGEPASDGPAGALKPRVIYIPGQYCVHPRGDLVAVGRRQMRLSYGFEELPNIERAVGLIREAAEYAEGTPTSRP